MQTRNSSEHLTTVPLRFLQNLVFSVPRESWEVFRRIAVRLTSYDEHEGAFCPSVALQKIMKLALGRQRVSFVSCGPKREGFDLSVIFRRPRYFCNMSALVFSSLLVLLFSVGGLAQASALVDCVVCGFFSFVFCILRSMTPSQSVMTGGFVASPKALRQTGVSRCTRTLGSRGRVVTPARR